MSPRCYFPDLSAEAFMHPTDKTALAAISMLKGLPALINWKNKVYDEKLVRIESMGNDIRVTKKSYARIYEMTELAAKVLGMPVPDVFINQSPLVNAMAIGTAAPMIQIYSGLIDLMNEDELQAVIAHEMGHIKCGHVLYKTVANLIRNGKSLLGPFDFVLDLALAFSLAEWDRKSEFTADRAAQLVTQDPKPVITMLMKLSGGSQKVADQINYEDFLEQSRQFQAASEGMLGKLCRFELTVFRTHPFAVMRASEIDSWSKSSEYLELLERGQAECPHAGFLRKMPIGLTAESGMKRAVRLKWSAPPFLNIAGYTIYRSENPTGGFSSMEVSGREETQFEDQTLADGKTYYYYVRAKDLYGEEGEPSPVVSAATRRQPAPLADFFPEGHLVREATLRWVPASGHEASMQVHLYRSDSAPDKYKKIASLSLSDGKFKDTGLEDGCSYFYKAVVNDDGIASDASEVIGVCTNQPLEAPCDMRAEYSGGMLSLQWAEVSEANRYLVYDDGAIYDSKIGESLHPNFSKAHAIKPGKRAAFYVKAIDQYGRVSRKSAKVVVQAA